MSKIERELKEAESLLEQFVSFEQYGAPAGTSPKNLKKYLSLTYQHFLQRDEPESIYYGRFNSPSEALIDEIEDADLPGALQAGYDSVNPDQLTIAE